MREIPIKDIPRYECLQEMSRVFPDMDPSAMEAYLHLIRTAEELFRRADAQFGALGTTQGRFLVLLLLHEKPGSECPVPRTPAEIAEHASVSRATVTGLLDSLEKDGFVVREPDPTDRRSVIVRLTDSGRAFLEQQALPSHLRLVASIMRGVPEEDRRALVRILSRLASDLAPEVLPEPAR